MSILLQLSGRTATEPDSQKASLGKAEVRLVTNDHVIQQRNVEHLASLSQDCGDCAIVGTG